ncbi:MAG: hypothetical protein ACRBCI_11525 [Cellvibrionaceae bacterium]
MINSAQDQYAYENASLALYGVSQEISNLVNSVCMAEASDGSPKYSDSDCREFRRRVLCRDLAMPIWWLSNLIVVINRDGKDRFVDFFWGEDKPDVNSIQVIVEKEDIFERLNFTDVKGFSVNYSDSTFFFNYSYISLLTILANFICMVDADFFRKINEFEDEFSKKTVDKLAKNIKKSLDTYLDDNLKSQQEFKKCKTLLFWCRDQNINVLNGAVDLNDASLDFWRYAIENKVKDFKLYKSTAYGLLNLYSILKNGPEENILDAALSLGDDYENGEIDIDRVDGYIDFIEAEDNFFNALFEGELSEIKFISKKEDKNLLSLLFDYFYCQDKFFKSVLRLDVFGSSQVVATQYHRKKNFSMMRNVLSEESLGGYEAFKVNLTSLKEDLEKTKNAVIYILYKAKAPEAIVEFSFKLSLDANCQFKEEVKKYSSEDKMDNIYNAFYDNSEKIIMKNNEFMNAYRLIKKDFSDVNRRGFKDPDVASRVNVYIEGLASLNKILNMLSVYLRPFDDCERIAAADESDRRFFLLMFDKIYGECYE